MTYFDVSLFHPLFWAVVGVFNLETCVLDDFPFSVVMVFSYRTLHGLRLRRLVFMPTFLFLNFYFFFLSFACFLGGLLHLIFQSYRFFISDIIYLISVSFSKLFLFMVSCSCFFNISCLISLKILMIISIKFSFSCMAFDLSK